MKALIFEGPGRLTLRHMARPVPAAGEVLIRVHRAAICGTDIKIINGQKTRDVRQGVPIGHECAGRVEAVGPGVDDYQPGERVAICVVVSCGTCDYCAADRENLCETRITLGYHTDGAFAEYMLIPERAVRRGNVFKLPADFPLEVAPLLEPMACCLNGQHEMGLGKTDGAAENAPASLVIFGAGPIGLIHLLLARAGGRPIGPVAVVEPQKHRRETARRLGADEVYAPEEFDMEDKYDAAICAVGVYDIVPVALRAVRKAGKVSLFAGYPAGGSVAVDPNLIHYKQIRVTGASESRRRDFAEALELVASGRVDPRPLMTHDFALEDYDRAFRCAADGSALKVAFNFNS